MRAFTLQEITEASKQLPPPHSIARRAEVTSYRVAITHPYEMYSIERLDRYTSVEQHVMDFELETIRDRYGSPWFRWVFKGKVAI